MRIGFDEQISTFPFYPKTAFLQFIKASHEGHLGNFFFEHIELLNLFGIKLFKELWSDVKSHVGHFGCFEFFVFGKILSLKDDLLDDLDSLLSLKSFLLDLFFLGDVEVVCRRWNNVKKGFVEENEIQLGFNFLRISF